MKYSWKVEWFLKKNICNSYDLGFKWIGEDLIMDENIYSFNI